MLVLADVIRLCTLLAALAAAKGAADCWIIRADGARAQRQLSTRGRKHQVDEQTDELASHPLFDSPQAAPAASVRDGAFVATLDHVTITSNGTVVQQEGAPKVNNNNNWLPSCSTRTKKTLRKRC